MFLVIVLIFFCQRMRCPKRFKTKLATRKDCTVMYGVSPAKMIVFARLFSWLVGVYHHVAPRCPVPSH